MCSTVTSCCAHSDRTLRCEEVVHNLSLDEQSVLAGNECLLRKIPTLSLMASREQKEKKLQHQMRGLTGQLMEAWRNAGYTPFDKCAIAARAAALGRRTLAVMIAARPAPKSGDFSSSSSSLSPSSSQPTPRTQPSASVRKRQTKKAAPLTVRSAADATSLPSSSSAIDTALRAHHNRKLFENSYVTGHCYFEAQAVSNKLTHGMGEKQGSKLMRSLYAAFHSGSHV